MTTYEVKPIGIIQNDENGIFIRIQPEYILALKELDGFSHIQALWWFSDYTDEKYRMILETEQPYQKAPNSMGTFATRSPMRPNPIALSVVEIINIDYAKGIIHIPYIDANDNTPLLDIKPYTPSLDRIESPDVPVWCSHWPKSLEESAHFEWEKEFNF